MGRLDGLKRRGGIIGRRGAVSVEQRGERVQRGGWCREGSVCVCVRACLRGSGVRDKTCCVCGAS